MQIASFLFAGRGSFWVADFQFLFSLPFTVVDVKFKATSQGNKGRDREMAQESSKADPQCRWRGENALERGGKMQRHTGALEPGGKKNWI